MIVIKLTLLLAINPNRPVSKIKKSSRKSSKKSSSRTSKSTSKNKSPKKPKLEDDEQKFPFYVEEPLCYIHINYDLLPKRFKNNIDVICWGPVAKIFTASRTKSFKTVRRNDLIWVPVYIEHYVNPLSDEEILKLLKHVITFNVTIGKNKLGAKAKGEKCKIFYAYEDDYFIDDFLEVYAENPYHFGLCKRDSTTEFVTNLLMKAINAPCQTEVVSWMNDFSKEHQYRIGDIMSKIAQGREIRCKEFTEEIPAKPKKKDKKKSKKKGKKDLEGGSFTIKIPAEVLFTDPNIAIYRLEKGNSRIPEAFVLVSDENLLTTRQKFDLLPLIVKIRKISNLPSQVLEDYGFKGVYAKCIIPNVVDLRTPLKPINSDIRFDFSKLICTQEVPKFDMLKILQGQRATVEIRGVKDMTIVKIKNKKRKNKKEKKLELHNKDDSVTLTSAVFDLSPLLNNFWMFKEKGQCLNPSSYFPDKITRITEYLVDVLTINEINLLQNPKNLSPLHDDILLKNATTIKFEASFLAPQYPSYHIKNLSRTYKRLLLIIFDENVAKILLNELLIYNQLYAGPGHFVPNILKKGKHLTDAEIMEKFEKKMLSGFTIDDGDHFIFFLEGLSSGHILTIIHEIGKLNPATSKVFFNSDHLFEERLYETFVMHNGIYIITVKIPLKEIFSRQEVYIKGNVPVMCLNAIKKLHLILNASTFKSVLHNELLPSEAELASFSFEYGLQLKYKDAEAEEMEENVKSERGFRMVGSDTDLFNV